VSGLHPYFSSALRWHTRLHDALTEARERGLKVFVQHGRQLCGGSRALVERTLAKEEVAEVMAAHFVAVASDADAPDPEVARIVAALPKHEPTPVCVYLDADGHVLASTAGGRPPAVLLNDMLGAATRR
jgi:hypothetical protein